MISLLVVNYRSAGLAIDAIRTARESTAGAMQVVVVDNSCDPEEGDALRGHADALLVSPTNRGYAGAINDGRVFCQGDTLVVCNPDVTFAPGAIDVLAAQLGADVAVAGPALSWDETGEWILPPSDLHTGTEKLDEVLASRSPRWASLRDIRRTRRRIAFWSLKKREPVTALSGAVLAIRARDFDDAGGFDERFRLYFEETDFLRRLQATRKHIVYVPEARCRHIYNQSAATDAVRAGALYAESERSYFAKWNGPFAAGLLKRLERPATASPAVLHVGPIELDRDDVVVEASPLPTFATAAGHFPRSRSVDLPPEVIASFRGESLYLRVVERTTARPIATYVRYGS